MAERKSNGKKSAAPTTLGLMDDEPAPPRQTRPSLEKHQEKPSTAENAVSVLFGGEEVDLTARHPADVPVGGYPAPSEIALLDAALLEAAPEPESPADPFHEEDPFAATPMAQMLAADPMPLVASMRAAREEVYAAAADTELTPNNISEEEEPPMPTTAAPAPDETSAEEASVTAPRGLTIDRRYTHAGENVWETCEWELRTASIVGSDGTVVFEQKGVEIPKGWSQLATNVVVSKYFRGQIGTLEREYSVKQLIGRVSDRILEWGREGGYFASEDDALAYHDELRYILLHQMAAFNSPVWFNLGWAGRRQAVSACLPYDARVNTNRGLLPIGEIVRLYQSSPDAAIYAYAPDGSPTRIVAAICNGRKRVINFHLADGSTLRCTSNHRVFIRDGKGDLAEKEAGDLEIGVDRLILNRNILLPESNSVELGLMTPDGDLSWLTGLMIGDGYCGRSETLTSDTWDLKLNTEPELKRAEATLTRFGVPFRAHKKPWGWCLRGHGAVSRNFWMSLGIWGRVGDKQVPEWLYRTSSANVCAFLSGLFDSDGHVSTNGSRRLPVFSNTSLPLVQAIQSLLRSLGIFSALTSYRDPRLENQRLTNYTLGIHDNVSVQRFEDLVGFTHAQKTAKMAQRQTDPAASWRPADVLLVSKTLGGPEYVYDIQTESETFWSEGLLLHNCYINEVNDTMESILDLYKTEGLLFKDGSGSGVNLSILRSSKEPLTAGGKSSGPISFMKGLDASAGSIKSGGSTRRAACMRVLDIDHPDIADFINCKKDAEEKAHALIDAGYSGAFNVVNGAYDTVPFQNANHSVRVTDEFMQAYEAGNDWETKFRQTGKTATTSKARDLMQSIAEATWVCGDPGMQYDTIINDWHTCSNTDRIYASNPCSEYMFLNSTACNLSSLNLMKFRSESGAFDVGSFEHAVQMMITGQEIVVGFAAYPTPKIEERSHVYRTLGLGYANLGALLMAAGLPYDSDAGRAYAGAVTAIMTGRAYEQSAKIARDCGGPFAGYAENEAPMLRVMRKHREHVEYIDPKLIPTTLLKAARMAWDDAIELGTESGYRNAQATVLAPTGCLVAGSLVITDRGVVRLNRLGDVQGDQWQDVNFAVLTDEGPRQTTKFYVNGLAQTRRITTHCGYAIQGTPKHRVKVVDAQTGAWDWKRFADIIPGDIVPLSLGQMIGTPQAVTLPPLGEEYWTGDYTTRVPRVMTSELAELVGYFMGDGSLHAKGPRFCVANTDLDVAERIQGLVKSLFNLEAHLTPQQGYCEVTVHSVPLTLWWEACGLSKAAPDAAHSGKGYLPCIPNAVLATNDPAVYGAFLRGLYEADGTVTGGIPCWSTVHREFSEEVKTLLLALGIPTSSKRDVTGWGNSALYVLRLRNTSYASRFKEVIGFISSRKSGLVSQSDGVQTARHDYVYLAPEAINQLVHPRHPLFNAVQLSRKRHNGAITRRSAESLLAETGDSRIAHALRFFYDVVTGNEDGGEQFTYDLSVPANVTYVAQGFVSHNTIGFLMDCDTTGIEPDIAIVKYKSLVGGGMMKIVNQTVPEALDRLGYSEAQAEAIIKFIDANDTIEGAPGLKPEHLPIFDCAFRPMNGTRSIHHMGHIKMMAAAQPFISGAISKTVNVPTDADPETIADTYLQAWKLGLKAVAIYRDGSKRTQPLNTSKEAPAGEGTLLAAAEGAPPQAVRRRLPDERASLTHKFSIGGHEGYLTVGLYPDTQQPGEIFIRMAKEGSSISGLMDSFATAISLALQYGVPLSTLVDKFIHSRFEPSGFTGNKDIPMAKSVMDYIFRYLALRFLQKEERHNVGLIVDQEGYGEASPAPAAPRALASLTPPHDSKNGSLTHGNGAKKSGAVDNSHLAETSTATLTEKEHSIYSMQSDAPPCPECGAITIRSGACYKCISCGTSLGCS